MSPSTAANHSVFAPHGMVTSVHHLASNAGVSVLQLGGSAVDAAIATSAVLAVTCQDQCGLGGDLFALIHEQPGAPAVLNSSGRAGSLADPDLLRSQGHEAMPHRGHSAAVTMPGCVDGWLTLHERFGRLDLKAVLAPAILYAERGFPVGPPLVDAASTISTLDRHDFIDVAEGARLTRPGVGRVLRAIVSDGRDGFYKGEFGNGLLETCPDQFTADDLASSSATWVSPLGLELFGHNVWTVPPNSQGYLALLGTAVAERVGIPDDPASPQWAHVMIEAARAAGHGRPDALYEGADGDELLNSSNVERLADQIDFDAPTSWRESWRDGGTIHLNVIDADGMGVSLIQSNARSFGSHLRVADTGIFLHNRGLGFSLTEGHPAEYGPGRRPPHTLSPLLITNTDGSLHTVLGTMGGDAQPHVLQQLLVRLLHHGASPHEALHSGRFVLVPTDPSSMFQIWENSGDVAISLESSIAKSWQAGLTELGHSVQVSSSGDAFGHAHCISKMDDHIVSGCSEPRVSASRAAGY